MLTAPIPRYILPHKVTLVKKLSSDGWGGSEEVSETPVSFVRIEPCRSQRFSLSGDIPEVRAKMFYDAFSSVPDNVSFEMGDEILFGNDRYIITEVQTFYGAVDIHHLEVLPK